MMVIKVTTVNVRSLQRWLPEALAKGCETESDIMVIQETRITDIQKPGIAEAFKKCGYDFHGSNEIRGWGAGVAVISKWPTTRRMLPNDIDSARVVAVRAHRPSARPVTIVGVYLHASDRRARTTTAEAVMRWVAAEGDDTVIIGDWNMTTNEEPLAEMCGGNTRELYEGGEMMPTSAKGRRIDYGLAYGSVYASEMDYFEGIADHKAVRYKLTVGGERRPAAVWPRRRQLMGAGESDANWKDMEDSAEARFGHFGEEALKGYYLAKECDDIDEVRRVMSDLAERLLEDTSLGKKSTGVPRSKDPKVHRKSSGTGKTESYQSLDERRPRRVLRRLAQWRRGDRDPALRRSLERGITSLGENDAEILKHDRDSDALYDYMQRRVAEIADQERKQRIDKWDADMQTSPYKAMRWVMKDIAEKEVPGDPDPVIQAETCTRC